MSFPPIHKPKEKDNILAKKTGNNSSLIRTNQSDNTNSKMIHLQQTMGNQAVQQMIKSNQIQAKLEVSKPNDPYEREADRVAKQIMRNSTFSNKDEINFADKTIHRDSFYEMKDRKIEEELKISRKITNDNLEVSEELSNQIINTSGGKPLNSSTKSFMESRFGYDFSDVKIHDNQHANELATSVNARAFTVGNNIFLGKKESTSDKSLMAHELVHVVQQNSSDLHYQKNDATNIPSVRFIYKKGEILQRGPEIIPLLDWITIGETGFKVANGIAGVSKGEVTYTLAELEGALLPGGGNDVSSYRKTHPNNIIKKATHTVAVYYKDWAHAKLGWDYRRMGIKFRIIFSYDGNALGSISMGIIERYDYLGWGGDVDINITPESLDEGDKSSIRLTINIVTDNSWYIPDYSGHIVFTLKGDGNLWYSSQDGDQIFFDNSNYPSPLI